MRFPFVVFFQQRRVAFFLEELSDGAGEDHGGDADQPGVLPADQEADQVDEGDGGDLIKKPEFPVGLIQLLDDIHAV